MTQLLLNNSWFKKMILAVAVKLDKQLKINSQTTRTNNTQLYI